jgi:hypothetical protein
MQQQEEKHDVILFAGLGLSYHFNLGRKELPPLLNYSASTEHNSIEI